MRGGLRLRQRWHLRPLRGRRLAGVALQPDFLAWEAVRSGRLTTVLEDWRAPIMTLNLLTPGGGPRAARVSVLLEFLVRRFKSGSAPWTLVGTAHV
jgi:DNA-binding transcriptional LysR family regulator